MDTLSAIWAGFEMTRPGDQNRYRLHACAYRWAGFRDPAGSGEGFKPTSITCEQEPTSDTAGCAIGSRLGIDIVRARRRATLRATVHPRCWRRPCCDRSHFGGRDRRDLSRFDEGTRFPVSNVTNFDGDVAKPQPPAPFERASASFAWFELSACSFKSPE